MDTVISLYVNCLRTLGRVAHGRHTESDVLFQNWLMYPDDLDNLPPDVQQEINYDAQN